MTVIDDLRRQGNAQPHPDRLTVEYRHLGALVEEIHTLRFGGRNMGRTSIRSELMRGEMTFHGLKIRVVNVPLEVSQIYINVLGRARP